MRDAIIIIVVLLLLLLLISVFGGSLRYTPSAETFYQSIDEPESQEEEEQEQEQEQQHEGGEGMPEPQVDGFADVAVVEEEREPSGEISPMLLSETFQQAEQSATDVMRNMFSSIQHPQAAAPPPPASKKEEKVEPFQNGGHFAAF
jgi:hypothetical protein